MDEQHEEEELPTGGPSRKRLRIDLAIGAALLLGVLVALRLTSGHSGHDGKATPTPTPSVSTPVGGYGTGAPDAGSGLLNGMSTCDQDYCSQLGVVPSGATVSVNPSGGWVVYHTDLPQRTAVDPGACPWPTGTDGQGHAVPGCTEDDSKPLLPTLAVLAVYPNAKLSSATTVYLGKTVLWFRQLNLKVGNSELVIRVEAPPSSGMPRSGTSDAPGGITVANGAQPPYFLYAQLDRPGQGAALAKLLKDPRLTQ